MLPGSSLLARLAGRPRPQWGRLAVRYAAPLDEERSKSRLATVIPQSGDYRGQRFMPLLGVGGLIGAAVTEEEDQAKQSSNHGKISVDTARLRLLREEGDAVGRYLLRRCKGDDIVTYVTKKGLRHIIIPSRPHSTMLIQNRDVNSLDEKVLRVSEKFGIALLYPVANEDQDQDQDVTTDNNDNNNNKKCHICEEIVNSQEYHIRNHRIKSCNVCHQLVEHNQFDTHMKSHKTPQFACQHCEYRAKYKHHLTKHVESQHSSQNLPYKCICGQEFKTKDKLENHERRAHDTRFKCQFCDKTFSLRKTKKDHEIKYHSGNRAATEGEGSVNNNNILPHHGENSNAYNDVPPLCGEIHGENAEAYNLTTEAGSEETMEADGVSGVERLGEDEGGELAEGSGMTVPAIPGQLQCDTCRYKATSSRDLDVHKRREHWDRGTMRHCCPHCKRSFSRKDSVKDHLDRKRCKKTPRTPVEMTALHVFDFAGGKGVNGVSNRTAVSQLKSLKKNGLLIPPPKLREILSMRLNWFRDHLKGEKQYWKNKDGEPLQEESTHVFCKDTAKTFDFILKMKQIKNPFLVVGIDHGQDKVLVVVFFVDLDQDLDRDWSTTNPDYRPLGRKRGITIDRADFCPENAHNLEIIFEKLQLSEALAPYKHMFIGDLKMANLLSGLQTHAAYFSCYICDGFRLRAREDGLDGPGPWQVGENERTESFNGGNYALYEADGADKDRAMHFKSQVRKPFNLHPDKNRKMSLVFGIDHLHVNKIGVMNDVLRRLQNDCGYEEEIKSFLLKLGLDRTRGKQPGGYNLSGPQMDQVLKEKHLNLLGSIIGARDPDLGLSIVGYYLSLKKMNEVMTAKRLPADYRDAIATFADHFDHLYKKNILYETHKVHIMKSHVQSTIEDLSAELGRPVSLWLMDTQGLEGTHWLTLRQDMTHNNRCTHRLGSDWHLEASLKSVCGMNFCNLLQHFPGGMPPDFGSNDEDYGPLPAPPPLLTPEVKAIVGELLMTIRGNVWGLPFDKLEDNVYDQDRLFISDVLENINCDVYEDLDQVRKALNKVIDDGWRSGPMLLNVGGRVVDFSPDLPLFVSKIRKKFVKVFENIEKEAAKRNTTSTANIDTNNENHADDENVDNCLDEMDMPRPVLETASSPMASLMPNNHITVNVDSEVGYSYSYSADLAAINEAELPHSSCTSPSHPPDSEPMDTYNMPILALGSPMEASDSPKMVTRELMSPCSSASSSVGDLRSSATLHQLADAVQPSPSPPPDSEPMDISDVQPMDTSDPSDDAELPMEASESPKKVAREPVSPCSTASSSVEDLRNPLDSDPATQKIATNNYDMPILSESPQLITSLPPVLEPIDTVSPLQDHVPGLQCPVCGEAAWSSASALQTHVDTHFPSPEAGPSTTADLQLARDLQLALDTQLQETQRRRREEEEAQFASLRAQYGMDEQGNYVQQSDAGLRQAVTSGRLSVTDYYERSQALALAERRGVDEGSSVTRSVARLVRAQAGAAQLHMAANTDHYASSYGDKGWGCGYRNLQMVLSCLLHNSHFRDVLAANIVCNKNNITMPSISKLQKLIEDAWQEGFDRMGCEQLGGRLVNTRKWIGATEIFTFLSYCGIDCEIVDFHRPSSGDGSHPAMFQWLLNYFRGGGGAACPVYLQHQGHSRTVLGVETAGAAVNLLVLDPSHSPTSMRSDQLMRLVRKPLGSMKSDQFQLVAVRGVITSPELRETKKIVTSTSPQYGLHTAVERLSSHPSQSHHSPAGSTSTATLRQIPTTVLELAASPTHSDRGHEPVAHQQRPRGDRDKEREQMDNSDSTNNNVISIPETADNMTNIQIISEGQLLLDSLEQGSENYHMPILFDLEPHVAHRAPSSSEKKSMKVAMEQQRQKLLREQDSQLDLALFTDASWTEENNEALRTSRKRAFGGAAVPLKLRLLQGVPHPPKRRQLPQLPRRQIKIPLHSNQEMQDPRI